jgi:TetR/AcrR family transcriptional regulator, transcriptional repressor of aconitase
MPKVSQAYRDARRAQILDAALVCFSRQGFHRVTMEDIVNQLRLSPGAIYNYFNSKEEIIEAIADKRHAQEKQIIVRAGKQASLLDALGRIGDAFFGELKNPQQRLHRRVGIQLGAEAQRNPRILRLVRRGVNGPRKRLSGILSEAQRRGKISANLDPDATARFLVGAFHGPVLQREWDDQVLIEPYQQLLGNFLASIAASSENKESP